MTFLDISRVDKSYGTHPVLHDINLAIEEGEFIVFVGPSGCGKSTLLRMISGLEDITGGTVRLGGDLLNDLDPSKRGVSMVFQSYALYPHMTVYDNISFGLRMAGERKDVIRRKVMRAAGILRLEELLDRRPANLSGGQKQRVAIGRAIVREPRLFLFDEPLSNLDAELRVQMRAELTELHRQLGTTMIYVTHDQVEAMTLADRMVVMQGGSVQQVGAPLELYDDPDNLFVAGFVGSPKMNFLPVTVTGHVVSGLPGGRGVPLPGLLPSGPTTLGLRPEFLRPLAAGETPPADAPLFPGRAVFAEELGDVTYLHVETDAGRLIARCPREARPAGDDVLLLPALSRALFFGAGGQRLRPVLEAAA